MWAYILRKLLYNIPVYLSILFLMMLCLRVRDPIPMYLGKNAEEAQVEQLRIAMGLDQPFVVQYGQFIGSLFFEWGEQAPESGASAEGAVAAESSFSFSPFSLPQESWQYPGETVGEMLRKSIPHSLAITLPTLFLSALSSIVIALISSYYRGRAPDRTLVFLAVIGMSVSYLVYIIFGQFGAAFWPQQAQWGFQPFATYFQPWTMEDGLMSSWVLYYLLPVLIGVVVAMGYDTRFYRAVMVEESGSDYIVTAKAKGAGRSKVMFVHMLKNAMIPIITRIMSTLPFLITGSILLEMYFGIPGMGKSLIDALNNKDFPVIQGFVAVIAALFLLSVILTDVCYALVDPRVRLS